MYINTCVWVGRIKFCTKKVNLYRTFEKKKSYGSRRGNKNYLLCNKMWENLYRIDKIRSSNFHSRPCGGKIEFHLQSLINGRKHLMNRIRSVTVRESHIIDWINSFVRMSIHSNRDNCLLLWLPVPPIHSFLKTAERSTSSDRDHETHCTRQVESHL